MAFETVSVGSDEQRHEQTNANVHVVAGGRLKQHGQVNGDVTVEKGGWLLQHGQVNGDITARAGSVIRLWGQVNGEVYAEPDSDFQIASGVMVNGRPHRYVAQAGMWAEIPISSGFSTICGEPFWRLTPAGDLEAP